LVRGCELNNVASGVYEPDSPSGTELTREYGLAQDDLPAAVLYDGRVLSDLSTMKVARAMGGEIYPRRTSSMTSPSWARDRQDSLPRCTARPRAFVC